MKNQASGDIPGRPPRGGRLLKEKATLVSPPYGSVWLIVTGAALVAWPGLLRNFFVSDDFMPHGHCYLWIPSLVRLHVVCDLIIGFSYVAISTALLYLVLRARREVPFHWMFVAFGLFIVTCGATHFMEVWTVWHPHYWLAGAVKLLTAGASLGTALAMPAVIANALDMLAAAKVSEERRRTLEKTSAELAEKNAALTAAYQEMETFSYSVAHDLRAPVRAMDGYASLIVEQYAGKMDEQTAGFLEKIRRNAAKMNDFIDALLAFSRLGRREIHVEDIDMNPLVFSAYQDAHAPGQAAPRLEVATLPKARGDATLVRQVLVNLLANAVKFSAGVEDPVIQVSGRVEGGECVYTVRDRGVGFDMRFSGKLFKVFQRLHGPEFEGVGIGLANVQRIVSRHGGRVWGEGRVGEGASFSFTLPRAANGPPTA